MTAFTEKQQFEDLAARLLQNKDYKDPAAFALGLATTDSKGELLEVFYEAPNFGSNLKSAAVMAHIAGWDGSTGHYVLSEDQICELWDCFAPFMSDEAAHGNTSAVKNAMLADQFTRGETKVVVTFIADVATKPFGMPDSMLRLHLLSHRLTPVNSLNLDGLFGKLRLIAWTSHGPIAAEELKDRQMLERINGRAPIHVHSLDRFPPMLDYVVVDQIRIADAIRVRLGARVGKKTTVMQEGFINFNAGTDDAEGEDGPGCMIEGRISQGVPVGSGSDLGGSFSIMGTLSGGGEEKITVGKGFLGGANGGLGISVGDNVKVESGLYVRAKIRLFYDGTFVKARDLSGISNVTFRFNNEKGYAEVVSNDKKVEMNDALHTNA